MKGQARIQFIIGIVIFAIIIFFIATQINVIFSSAFSNSQIDKLRARAIGTITYLIEDSGDPIDWYLNPLSAERIGLADTPYNLAETKIETLSNNCNLLNDFQLKGYRLTVLKGSDEILFCGFIGTSPLSVTISRKVLIDGDDGEIKMEMWV